MGTPQLLAALLIGTDSFYLALGRFVAKFSQVEALLQTAVWSLAGVPPPTAQAVFPGLRIDACMGHIVRISDAQNWTPERKGARKHIFDQLGIINKLRNNILHYGAHIEGPNGWRISNEPFVHLPKNISSQVISPQTLKDAQDDLDVLIVLLVDLVRLDLSKADALALARSYAWKYKPAIQTGRQKKNVKAEFAGSK